MNIQQALVAAYNSRDDVAFDRLTEQVMKRVTDLEQKLLTAAGDDLCRLSQEEIKAMSLGSVPIPPKEEFLASCERFHAQVAGEAGVNSKCLTLAQLIAENERLEQELNTTRKMLGVVTQGELHACTVIDQLEQGIRTAKEQADRLWEANAGMDRPNHLTGWQMAVLTKVREALSLIPPQRTPAKQESVQEK